MVREEKKGNGRLEGLKGRKKERREALAVAVG